MPRRYQVEFSAVACSAAQDLVQITGASGKMIRILRLWVACTNTSLAAGQMLQLRGRVLGVTVTVGSGGTTGVTPSKVDPGDANASTATCAINNTVKATSNGTVIVVHEGACHLFQGYVWKFDEPIPVGPTSAFVFELIGAPSGTVNLSGGCLIEEIG